MSTLQHPTGSFLQEMLSAGVTLPLHDCPDEPNAGVVVDLADQPVFTVDVNRELPGEQADGIAKLIVRAVNAHEGLVRAAQPIASLVDYFTGADDDKISVTAGELRELLDAVNRANEA